MKFIISILLLILSLQSWTKADVINELEIEGISIGDSLLDYMDEDNIKKAHKTYYPNPKNFEGFYLNHINSEIYDRIGVDYENTSNLYKIHSIQGFFFYNKEIDKCLKQKKEIVSDLSEILKNSAKISNYNKKFAGDETGKSKSYVTDFDLDDGSGARVMCIDMSEEKNLAKQNDYLQVVINSTEYNYYLAYEAYNTAQ